MAEHRVLTADHLQNRCVRQLPSRDFPDYARRPGW